MAAMASLSLERASSSLLAQTRSSVSRNAKLVVRSQMSTEQQSTGPLASLEKMATKYVPAVAAMNAMLVLPALAEEKGALFDFNLTLPIIAIEFLLTMTALNKIWFEPVSKVMDSRDEEIRKKLTGVRDNADEIKQLQTEAESVLKAARAETLGQSLKMKKELAAELDAKLQATRGRIEKELESALANLDRQKVETMKSLDSQVQALSDEIVQKLIPFKA